MLTTAEEDRLEDLLPLTAMEVTYEGAAYQYDIAPWWWGGDAVGDDASTPPAYPALALQFETQNQPETARQPANNLQSIDNPANEPGLTETRTEEVSDDLSMMVVVEATHDDNGVPPQVRCSQLTRHLWRFIQFDLDDVLNTPGANGERPMRSEITSSPTPTRVQRTLQAEWSVRLHHAETQDVEVDTAAGAEYSAEQTDN